MKKNNKKSPAKAAKKSKEDFTLSRAKNIIENRAGNYDEQTVEVIRQELQEYRAKGASA